MKKLMMIGGSGVLGLCLGLALFCHLGKIRRIYAVSAHEKSRFHPTLTKEG